MNLNISDLVSGANGGVGLGIWSVIEGVQKVLPDSVTGSKTFKRALPIAPLALGALAGLAGIVSAPTGDLGSNILSGLIIGLITSATHQIAGVTIGGKVKDSGNTDN